MGMSVKGDVMSQEMQIKLGLTDDDACFGFEAKGGFGQSEADDMRCSFGPRTFQNCASDWDCRGCAKEGACDAKEMQTRCIAREDASALQQAGYEEYLGREATARTWAAGYDAYMEQEHASYVEPDDTTYVQLCPNMSHSFPVGWFTVTLEMGCGVGFWGKASAQACVSPEFGIAAEIVPGATFVARTRASVALVMIRGGVEGDFSSQASVVAGAELDLPWRICPTVRLELVPLIVKVRAFVEFGVMWWWCCTLRWPIAEWRSGGEPPVRMCA